MCLQGMWMREYKGIVCLPAKENAYEICLRMLFLIWELPGEWLGIGKKHTSSYPPESETVQVAGVLLESVWGVAIGCG